MIRNNYLYHYPNDKNVDKAFEAVPEDQPWEWYLSHANTNSIYLSSELVLGYGMMNTTGKSDPLEAFGEMMAKTMALANTMPEFLMRLVEAICFKYLGKDVTKPQARTVFKDPPELGTFWIPFFAEPDPEPVVDLKQKTIDEIIDSEALARSRPPPSATADYYPARVRCLGLPKVTSSSRLIQTASFSGAITPG